MSKHYQRLLNIKESLEDIEFILKDIDFKITKAIQNRILKPAIRMHIIKIAEQFSKLKDENEFKVLEQFNPNDLRGINAVRNFIAHDYDSVDDNIIEDVLRDNFPEIKNSVENILSKNT